MPLAAEAPAVTTGLRRKVKQTAPYSLVDALQYPLRGLGAYVFWGYVVVLSIFFVLGAIPGLGCAVFLLQLLIFLMVPGLLFRIIRTTAEGEDELPDWPDWTELGQRLFEWAGAFLAFGISVLPTIAFLVLLGCRVEDLGRGGGLRCALGMILGSAVGAAIWMPAFGAVAIEWNPFIALRIDLHVRALRAVGEDGWKTLGLLVSLLAVRQVLGMILSPIPLLGGLAQIVVGIYTLLMGAHFIGLLFRRHSAELDAIYN